MIALDRSYWGLASKVGGFLPDPSDGYRFSHGRGWLQGWEVSVCRLESAHHWSGAQADNISEQQIKLSAEVQRYSPANSNLEVENPRFIVVFAMFYLQQ